MVEKRAVKGFGDSMSLRVVQIHMVENITSIEITKVKFESSVNSYGRKTTPIFYRLCCQFESSVNSYGRKTCRTVCLACLLFESSVNSYGRKTEN